MKGENSLKTVEVVSAVALSGAQLQEIKSTLEAKLKTKVVVTATIDKTILGGLKIIIEGEVIDDSLAGKLAQLKNQFSQNFKE
jgi:F-type H+-transporting ATPase subunit delta